jgi:hypothetical protein
MPNLTSTAIDLPRLTASPPSAQFWGLTPASSVVPSEVPDPVSVASERFVNRIERLDFSKRDSNGLSAASRAALEQLERLHPDADRDELIEIALILEASAGNIDQFRRAVANPQVLPTDHGDLVVLDYLALTPMLARDPDNPRTILRLGSGSPGHYTYTSPVLAESDDGTVRTLEFRDVQHYLALHDAQRGALGFEGAVRNARDRLDLERGLRLGILKPATVAPVRVRDRSTGDVGLQLGLVDANRRLTLIERGFQAVRPQVAIGEFSRRHFYDGSAYSFRRFTSQDAHDARESLADAFADIDAPGPTGDPDADARTLGQWAREIDDNHPERAALIRLRVMRSRVVLGVDEASNKADTNPIMVAIGAYRDQLHLPELADVGWTPRATEAMVGHEMLRRSRDRTCVPALEQSGDAWQDEVLFQPETASWHLPGIRSTHELAVAAEALGVGVGDVVQSAAGVAALVAGLAPALPGDGPEDRPRSVLDLVLATTATLVCRDQPMTPVLSEILAQHRMHNSPKARGQIAAALLLPLLGLPADGSDTATAYAALSRTMSHGAIYKIDVSIDPLGQDMRWIDLIGWDWFDVVERARAELASRSGGRVTGEGSFGPAQTLLAFASAISLEVSPAVVTNDERGRNANQVTLSGLGGQRGEYKGEPLALLLPLTTTAEGIDQLFETIVAAIASSEARVARSVRWDSELDDDRIYGPFLTEYDLRGPTWGHGRSDGTGDGGHGTYVRVGASTFVARIFARVASDIAGHADEVSGIKDQANRDTVDPELDPDADDFGGSPTRAYLEDGIDVDVAERILDGLDVLRDAAQYGKLVRVQRSNG